MSLVSPHRMNSMVAGICQFSSYISYWQCWCWQPQTELIVRGKYKDIFMCLQLFRSTLLGRVNENDLVTQGSGASRVMYYIFKSIYYIFNIHSHIKYNRMRSSIQNDKCSKCQKKCDEKNKGFGGKGIRRQYLLTNISIPHTFYETKDMIRLHPKPVIQA